MSLAGFYFNKQPTEISQLGAKYLYNYELEKAMALGRLRVLFWGSELDRVVDEVC